MQHKPLAFALKVFPHSQVESSWCVYHPIRDTKSCARYTGLLYPAQGVEGLLQKLVARQCGCGTLILDSCDKTKIQEAQVGLLP